MSPKEVSVLDMMEARDRRALLFEVCTTPKPGLVDRETLEALDLRFRELNLSPGGSADLLAICYLLHFMKTETLV